MASFFILVDIVAAFYGFYLLHRLFILRGPPLPPGPKRLPLIDNLLDIPKQYNWIYWAKYKERYGPISSISVLGQNFIILNDQKSSIELLEKRSSNYSDRPNFSFAYMAGFENITTLLQYGDVLAAHRKNMHRFIGTKDAISKIHPIEELEARRFVYRVLTKPKSLLKHIQLLTGAIILKVSHGYEVDTQEPDFLVGLADKSSGEFSQAAQPGKWIVDMFPYVNRLPNWMPGTGFKQTARSWRRNVYELAERPHQFVKQQMAAGIAAPSFASLLLEQNPSPEEEYIAKWSAATLYGGGSDTTVSAVESFFIAMLLHPEVQRKAQAEIDSVVGLDHLPTFSDRQSLPYVNATLKEVLRWNTVLPLCPPHVARADDVYQGYAIPKGSLVIANIWAINHDPENYHDPYAFIPERYLGVDEREPEMDPRVVTFGYGRRICPGKDLADATIFISIAICLATLDIKEAKDEAGREIKPKYEVTDGLISHPKPFQCSITARSAKARELIMLIEEEGVDSRGDAAQLSNISLDMRVY